MKRWKFGTMGVRALVITVGLVATAVGISADAKPAAAWDARTRAETFDYAGAGVWEKYEFGGTRFFDNNIWDANEGIDCSAYVSKAWALPYLMDPMDATRLTPPMYTGSWWNYQVDGATEYGWNDGAPDYLMNAFVWHNGTGQHMGLLTSYNYSTGYYATYEALNPGSGVIPNQRTWQDIESDHAAKRFIRNDWTP